MRSYKGCARGAQKGCKLHPLHPLILFRNLYHYIGGDTSALTKGAASELIRNDELAFLYAKPGPMPPLSPVFRRNTRLGLQHEPGSFVNLSDQPRRDSIPRVFSRICRVPRVRRVIRVIRVRIGQRPGDLLSFRAYCRSFLSHLQNDSSIFIVVAIMQQLGIDE